MPGALTGRIVPATPDPAVRKPGGVVGSDCTPIPAVRSTPSTEMMQVDAFTGEC